VARRGAQVVDAGAVPLLVLAAQEPEAPLRRVAASALADIAKHSPELAQAVVDAGAAPAPCAARRSSAGQRSSGQGALLCLHLQAARALTWSTSACFSHHARWQMQGF
jgi:hypothetical protein